MKGFLGSGILLLGFLVYSAGCTRQATVDPPIQTEGRSIEGVGHSLMVVNATRVADRLELALHLSPDCLRSGEAPRVSYALFDSMEPTGSGILDVAAPGGSTHKIALSGTAPFILGTDFQYCISSKSQLLNITSGYGPLGLPEQMFGRAVISVTIPVGGTTGTTPWTPGDFVWNLLEAYPEPGGKQGETVGRITLVDAKGDTVRSDYDGLLDSTTEYNGFMLVPGTYAIRLELDYPATVPTVWNYIVEFLEMNRTVCMPNVAWPFCEQDAPG